jgi:hypothetical protein
MWIRWVLVIALLYLLYRLFRASRSKSRQGGEGMREIPKEDVLVQDPWCKTFIPRSQALEARSGNEVVHFCTPECRDRYLESERGRRG